MGGIYYEAAIWFFGSFFGKVGLFLSLLGFYYHLSNGIRHLAWDLGYGLNLKDTQRSNWFVITAAFALTILTWF